MRIHFAVLACILTSSSAFAERVGPAYSPDGVNVLTAAAPRIARESGVAPMATLASAAEQASDQVVAIRQWNAAGYRPAKNGFARSLPHPISINLSPSSTSKVDATSVLMVKEQSLLWGGRVDVADAHRFRVKLSNVRLPEGTRFWIYGQEGEAIPFDLSLLDHELTIWTPSIQGAVAYLEVQMPLRPATRGSFEIREVMEIVRPQVVAEASSTPTPDDAPTCLVDATCITSSTLDVIDGLRRAVAYLEFVEDSKNYICSGSLVNDKDTSGFIPYLLTANHCFSTQASASSLEAFWDYKTAVCSGSFPNIDLLQRSNGAQLLATASTSDFTLVRLNGVPGGRFYLGWDTGAVANGTTLHRLSHPFPDAYASPAPQRYSSTSVTTTRSTCDILPRPNFLYSNVVQGGGYGGSSGSPAVMSGGYIVGQLYGWCGPASTEGCDARNANVDGAFSVTYNSIASYLDNAPSTSSCVANATTACVLNNRFKVTVRYRTAFDNQPVNADAQLKSVTGFASASYETAFFYFNNPNNIEMMIKLLDQGNVDSQNRPTIAVLFGTATPLRIELTITDTKNGAVKKYGSEFAKMQGVTDFTAFVK